MTPPRQPSRPDFDDEEPSSPHGRGNGNGDEPTDPLGQSLRAYLQFELHKHIKTHRLFELVVLALAAGVGGFFAKWLGVGGK